ncbi:hypothetical protein QLQ15_12525 [Lysobacter sp. LF1]|uniref:STAS/SEC14 domain-containing protein n=1 Tax=Lysobacter stagni TaxID=3045172 RepID=A0ABT6XHU3_9GAMM|nr:hypothetical protein [Lysobacter sp. LF1]MDI9239729.1 hypothetical protein [Lysobacter sp. LF1]
MVANTTASPLQVEIAPHPQGLRVRVQGEETLANTIAYWRDILAAAKSAEGNGLLLLDELQGEPLTEEQWLELVVHTDSEQLRRMKIAHVKPRGLQEIEYCEIYARANGVNARVFVNEAVAELWLREG